MRPYEIMIIFDPNLEEKTVGPTLDRFLKVVRDDGGSVDKVDIWGKRRLAYDILKHSEGIYAVVNFTATPTTAKELDRLLGLAETVLRTKLLRAYPVAAGDAASEDVADQTAGAVV
ncbi:MAG: 30S ribosomal protein S6 [Bifidobacteriaceae bacterium]|jgi:small subunit ribosomal protein S6|nr:30S ribosomal protein S6 [Bifidobacteriaceae bacterium]